MAGDPFGRGGTGGAHAADPFGRGTGGGKKKPTGGVLGVLERGGSDLVHAAVDTPAGIKYLATHNPKDTIPAIAKATVEDFKHPLRHPGNTALDVLGLLSVGAGTAARIGAVGRAVEEGAKVGEVARAALSPKVGVRSLKVGDLETRGHYSKSALSRGAQKLTDKTLQKTAAKPTRVGERAENVLHRRASKWDRRNERVAEAVAREPGTTLSVLGKKLKPEELRALRLVAEETPAARRLGAQEMRKARAKGPEAVRHQERIDVTKKAMAFLDEDPDGKPVFKPEAKSLQRVYHALKRASSDREHLLKNLNLMDEEHLRASKTNVARVAAGAKYEKPTPGKLGTPSQKLIGARARVERIGALVDKAEVRQPLDNLIPTYLGGLGDTRAVAGLRSAHSLAKEDLQRLEDAHARRQKPTGIVGQEDIVASPEAVFIGNPVERGKLSGKPKVSSTGSFGHTRRPGSLKTSTGGSVEHAMERGDVTNVVAERHHEAVRLSKIDRARKRLAKAGEKTPHRRDDVWIWTDDLTSNERIPKDVRKYLDDPESIAQLNPDEQLSVTEKLKKSVFEQHDWHLDDTARESFEKLAEKGDGVFVPRRLVGEYAKREYMLGDVPGIKFADAVNNAQKAGLIYLKLNYPVVQALSNVAMGIIQQGFAAPRRLAQAVRLQNKIGPEGAAVIQDIMGGGAILQTAFEGQGRLAGATQKLAHFMSSKVDTPSRDAAFLHEAIKAGFDTPEKWKLLISDDRHAGDLAEVAQRAKEAIVDYGDLSPFERSVVRRLVFVYPWQKGAAKFAGHFLRDHPVQAAALGQIGRQGHEDVARTVGDVPSYLEGVFDVGGKLVNPSGVNFLQTPAQEGQAAAALLTGNMTVGSQGQNFLSPAPALAVQLLTGRDDLGRPIKRNIAANLRDILVAPTPAASATRALTNDWDISRKVLGDRTSSKTFPNKNDALYRFMLGGLYLRKYSKAQLHKNAGLDKSGR